MIGKIETTQDINAEKERLAAEAEQRKREMKRSFSQLQQEVNPTQLAKNALNSPATPEVLKYGATIASFALASAILPRGSWLLKLAVPFIAHRYASRYVDENYSTWSQKLTEQLERRQGGQAPHQLPAASENSGGVL
ncbi:MAG: hypothetical protein MUD08_08495 [Cytophagales bacterium]|jgi:hypothetical protein|nr:hypothetical protein [Cytophagales bacterium]